MFFQYYVMKYSTHHDLYKKNFEKKINIRFVYVFVFQFVYKIYAIIDAGRNSYVYEC